MKTDSEPGNLELRDIPKPAPSEDEALVEVRAAGICGTDVHIKHNQAFHTPPVVLGHEYSGTVVSIGSNVSTIQVGDEVVSPATAYCGQCPQCKTGHVNRCTDPNRRILGVSRANGAFAQYLTVPEYIIHKVPESVPLEEAALAEPTACVVHALIEKTPICPGDVVVIQGPGTMGLLSLQVAKAMGAGKAIVTGMSSDRWRLDIAENTGADRTIDIEEEDPVEIVNEESHGLGADVVIEASGSCAACGQALQFVKVAGHVALLGVRGRPAEIDLDQMIIRELTMTGTWGTIPSSWVTTLKLMASHKIDVAPLITHRLSLDEWEMGFQLMEEQKAIKVLFEHFS